jgi:hypothetical protein
MLYHKRKVLATIAILFIITVTGYGQDGVNTLFGEAGIKSTFFCSADIGYSSFNSENLMFAGLSGGVVFNKKLAMGLALKSNFTRPLIEELDNIYTEGLFQSFYAGLLIEPVFLHDRVVHLSIPILTGGGMAGYLTQNRYTTITTGGSTKMRRRVIDSDVFFVIEPGVNCEVNLTEKIRLIAGLSYRLATGLELVSTSAKAFNTLSGRAGIVIGMR